MDPNARTPPTPRASRRAEPPPTAGPVRRPGEVRPSAPTPHAPATRDARTPARRIRAARDHARAPRPATSAVRAEPTTAIARAETTSSGRHGPKAREALGLPRSDRLAREKTRSRKAEKPLPGEEARANARQRLRTAQGSGTARAARTRPASPAAPGNVRGPGPGEPGRREKRRREKRRTEKPGLREEPGRRAGTPGGSSRGADPAPPPEPAPELPPRGSAEPGSIAALASGLSSPSSSSWWSSA